MTISQIDYTIGMIASLLIFGLVVVLPVSIYLCVKMGTAALLITRNRYLKKEDNEDECSR